MILLIYNLQILEIKYNTKKLYKHVAWNIVKYRIIFLAYHYDI